MKRAALYLRVSSIDQHPETQLHDLEVMAQQRGLEIVQCYTDRITGTRSRRPDLDQMMADARRHRFDVLLVWASDRLARSVRHFLEVLDELNHLGIEFVSFREQLDTTGPLARAVVVIIGAIAELERSLIVERSAPVPTGELEGPISVATPQHRPPRCPTRSPARTVRTHIAKAHRCSRGLVSKILRDACTPNSHKGVPLTLSQANENRSPI